MTEAEIVEVAKEHLPAEGVKAAAPSAIPLVQNILVALLVKFGKDLFLNNKTLIINTLTNLFDSHIESEAAQQIFLQALEMAFALLEKV
jgi:hypothetical protein